MSLSSSLSLFLQSGERWFGGSGGEFGSLWVRWRRERKNVGWEHQLEGVIELEVHFLAFLFDIDIAYMC